MTIGAFISFGLEWQMIGYVIFRHVSVPAEWRNVSSGMFSLLFYVLPLLSLISPPFVAIEDLWNGRGRLQSLNNLDETLEKFCFVTGNFTAFGTILPNSKVHSSSTYECVSCRGAWPMLLSSSVLLLCFTRLEFHFVPACNIPGRPRMALNWRVTEGGGL